MLYEQEKWEKTLPDSSSPDRTRLSTLSLSKSRRKMSPFALQCEEKPPHLKARKETAPRNINGTSCHWGWRGKKTHLHTHTHASRKIQNTQYGPPRSWKTWIYQMFFRPGKVMKKGQSHWNGYYLIFFLGFHVLLKNI